MSTNPAAEKIGSKLTVSNEEECMESRDVYKELRLRGYQYSQHFPSITSASISGSKGHIAWYSDWVAFLDNILQIKILKRDTRGLFVPTGLKKLVIDTNAHYSNITFGEVGKSKYISH